MMLLACAGIIGGISTVSVQGQYGFDMESVNDRNEPMRFQPKIDEMRQAIADASPLRRDHRYGKLLVNVLEQNQHDLVCGLLIAPIYSRILTPKNLWDDLDPTLGFEIKEKKQKIKGLALSQDVKNSPVFSYLMRKHKKETRLETIILQDAYDIFRNNYVLTHR